MHPDKFPRPFGPRSDIDIAVIDDTLFDRIRHAVIDWHYPRKARLYRKRIGNGSGNAVVTSTGGFFHPDKIR